MLHGGFGFVRSSPRTWGCFYLMDAVLNCAHVFPTHVGVFPSVNSCGFGHVCLPHARGGVSKARGAQQVHTLSSPRTWGCFPFDQL